MAARLTSPFGGLTAFHDGGELTGLYFDPAPAAGATASSPRDSLVRALAEQLDRYWAGDLRRFDVPLRLAGTPFQLDVWTALQRIPFGQTVSYSAIAHAIGRPSAVRAVGRANGSNRIAIIVPCHRVIGADGTLTGYAGGIERKRGLLALERDALASGSSEAFEDGAVAAHP